MEKCGFIYLWYDRKHKRFYIGCHWGTEDDGYICSSTWMNLGYKKRPNDFKRKILQRDFVSKKEMFDAENRWLALIKEEELGNRYYNLQRHWQHWSNDEAKAKSSIEKMRNTKKKYWNSPESDSARKRASEHNKRNGIKPPSRKGKSSWNKGLNKSDPRVAKLAKAISKPKSNTEKMGKHGQMPPSQKGRRYNVVDGKRIYWK